MCNKNHMMASRKLEEKRPRQCFSFPVAITAFTENLCGIIKESIWNVYLRAVFFSSVTFLLFGAL